MAAAVLLRRYPLLRRRANPGTAAARSCSCRRLQHRPLSSSATGSSSSSTGSASADDDGSEEGESYPSHDHPPPRIPDFPWLHWGFRDGEEVNGYCLPTVMKVAETMKRIPFSSVEDQMEARGLTVGEFKEGATIAYHHVAELYAAAGAATNAGDVPNKRDAVPEGGKAGEDRIAEEAEGMVDKYLLQALRTQQETYTALNWEAKLTTRSVRATPLTVVVAPSQRLDWSGSQSVGPPGWFDKLSRIFAVMRGLLTAATGKGGSFALFIDCHFEVEEDFQIIDLDTGNTVVAELGERDHVWTFMAKMDRPLDADDDLSFVIRDINYFVSHNGIIDDSTLTKLRRPSPDSP